MTGEAPDVDIRPDVYFLHSIRADRGFWWVLAAEAIDNGLQWGASQIAVTLARPTITIQDNGEGITRDRALSIVRLGEHRPGLTAGLSKFGIGITYNAMSAADYFEVQSISRDGRLDVIADWDAMLRRGDWKIAPPQWTANLRHGQTGTRLTLKALRWSGPTPSDVEKTREQLAAMFRPALATDRRITINGVRVPYLAEPELTDIVDTTLQLPSGKGARIRGGLLRNPESSSLYMVNVVYRYRVIAPRSAFGTRGFSGLRKMFAEVALSGDWGLRRFKDGIEDPDAELLDEYVGEALRPILEQCHSAQISTSIEDMAARLNEMLPPDLIGVRPPKKKPSDDEAPRPPRRPGKQGGISQDGTRHPRGPARRREPRRTLIIEFDGPLAGECGYGQFKQGSPNKIVLAKDNPDIAEWLAHRDRPVAARAIYAVAMMIYEHAREHGEVTGQPELPLGPFGLRVWQLAEQEKRQLSMDTERT